MKIALVLEKMDPACGGCETYTAQIAEALAGRLCDVTVFCEIANWQPPQPQSPSSPAVKIRPLGQRGGSKRARLTNFLSDVRQAVAKDKFDIVHSMVPMPGANVYQPHGGTAPQRVEVSLRRRRGVARLLTSLGERLNFYRRWYSRLERRIVSDPGVLCLAVSEMVAAQFQRFYHRSQAVRVVYNSAVLPEASDQQKQQWRQQKRREIGSGSGETIFLTAAGNFPLKGVAETIDAFASWQKSQSNRPGRLVVIGRSAPRAYQRLAERLGVGDRVTFLPHSKHLHQWYAAADACILLSWYDSCSLVVLEAVSWLLPAITTQYNGAAEVLRGGAGAVVSSPLDKQAIVAAMAELSDPDLRRARQDACRQAASRLTLRRHVDELLLAYDEVRKS